MVRGLCDREDRLAARLFVALESTCPCCTFYRGVALGLIVGALAAAVIARFI